MTATTGHASTTDGDTVLGVVTLDTGLGDIPPGSPRGRRERCSGRFGHLATAPDAAVALVPIDVARQIATEIIDDGTASHSWLGITGRDVSTAELESGLPAGVLVTYLTAGGPARLAGIEAGDVVVAVAHEPVDSVSAMVGALHHHEPGETVSVQVERDGAEHSFSVRARGARPGRRVTPVRSDGASASRWRR